MNELEEKLQAVITFFDEASKLPELSSESLRGLEVALGIAVKPIDMDQISAAVNTLRSAYGRIGLVKNLIQSNWDAIERVKSLPPAVVKQRRKRRTKAEMAAARAAGLK